MSKDGLHMKRQKWLGEVGSQLGDLYPWHMLSTAADTLLLEWQRAPYWLMLHTEILCPAGRIKVVTEYYQQLPDGSLVKVKPLMDTEKPLPRPQTEALPAQGLSHVPLNTLTIYSLACF